MCGPTNSVQYSKVYKYDMDLVTYERIVAKIREKFPNASDEPEDIEDHIEEFEAFERRLNLKNVCLRAISLPQEDDGMGAHIGKTTYHWSYYDEHSVTKLKTYTDVTYCPPAPPKIKPRDRIFNENTDRRELPYSAYLDFKHTVDADFTVPKNYFVPDPDPNLTPEDAIKNHQVLNNMKDAIEIDSSLMNKVEKKCEEFIKDRYDELLKEYKETYNDYHLFRADFYRKLKFEHMELDDQLLIFAFQQKWIENGYFFEKELREAYADKIESL